MYYRRQRLGCDNFIELIHKYGLIKNKPALLETIKNRYSQTKRDTEDTTEDVVPTLFKQTKQVQTDPVMFRNTPMKRSESGFR